MAEEKRKPIRPRVYVDPLIEAIDSAYSKLPEEEAHKIDKMAVHLANNVKLHKRSIASPMFGYTSALELIAKIGIYLNKTSETPKGE